MINFRK